jgi:hypothetical protein
MISGNLVAKFPLQQLMNKSINEKFLNNTKYTFLSFRVEIKRTK